MVGVSGKKPELCRGDGRGATFHINDPEGEGLRRIKLRLRVHLLERLTVRSFIVIQDPSAQCAPRSEKPVSDELRKQCKKLLDLKTYSMAFSLKEWCRRLPKARVYEIGRLCVAT